MWALLRLDSSAESTAVKTLSSEGREGLGRRLPFVFLQGSVRHPVAYLKPVPEARDSWDGYVRSAAQSALNARCLPSQVPQNAGLRTQFLRSIQHADTR